MRPPSAPWTDVPPVRARGRNTSPSPESRVDLIYVNGIITNPARQLAAMEEIAETLSVTEGLQAELRGVHAGTEGLLKDAVEATADKLGLGRNAAVETLRDTILEHLLEGRPINLVLSSQGTIIGSRALKEAKVSLTIEEGMSLGEVEALMGEKVRVLTAANAQWTYPDGPHYRHFVNTEDGITSLFGLGSATSEGEGLQARLRDGVGRAFAFAFAGFRALLGRPGPALHPGRESEVTRFSRDLGAPFGENHGLLEAYLDPVRGARASIMESFFMRASTGRERP
ncbi:MAG: hypothetical protein AAFZ18_16005 [Myxococcota bacterium]